MHTAIGPGIADLQPITSYLLAHCDVTRDLSGFGLTSLVLR